MRKYNNVVHCGQRGDNASMEDLFNVYIKKNT